MKTKNKDKSYAYPQETSTQDHPACLKHYHKKRNDTESSVQLSSVPFLFYICLIWWGGSKQGRNTQGSDALVFCKLLPNTWVFCADVSSQETLGLVCRSYSVLDVIIPGEVVV